MAKQLLSVYPSLARTATPTAVNLEVSQHSGLILIIDVTAIAATPSVVFTIHGHDPVSGKTWPILASVAVTTVSTVILEVFPGTDEAANLSENAYLPYSVRVTADHADSDSITYTVSAHLLN